MNSHPKRNLLEDNQFQTPGEESLRILWSHNIIYNEYARISSLDVSQSMKLFLGESQHHESFILPTHCTHAFTLGNHHGMIRFPTSDSRTRPIPMKNGPLCVTPTDTQYNRVEGHDFTGWCKNCIDRGKWGVFYQETGRIPIYDEKLLVCVRPCYHCAQENRFKWGEYKLDESDPWIPISNNGTHPESNETEYMTVESSHHEMITMTLKGLWNHHPDHDPPYWSDFIARVPYRISEIVSDIFGFQDDIRHQRIDPHSQEIIDGVYDRLYSSDSGFPIPYPYRPWEHTDEAYSEEAAATLEADIHQHSETEHQEPSRILQHVSQSLQILEDVMDVIENPTQTLSQGKYLELCMLLKNMYQ
jgi:hypothetical protein